MVSANTRKVCVCCIDLLNVDALAVWPMTIAHNVLQLSRIGSRVAIERDRKGFKIWRCLGEVTHWRQPIDEAGPIDGRRILSMHNSGIEISLFVFIHS